MVALAKENPKEYIVIVFSLAEKAKDVSGAKYGSVNPIWVLSELTQILNTEGIKEYLYTDISSTTAINDVLSSRKNVIVKINYNNDDFYNVFASVDHDNNTSTNNVSVVSSGIMGSFGSISANSTYNLAGDNITDIAGLNSEQTYTRYFTEMQTDSIYNGINKTDLIYCYHQAQNTSSDQTRGLVGTGIPTLGMRMDAIDNVIARSKTVYDNSTHDHWFQLGIGGSIDGDNPSGVSDVLNPYLSKLISTKLMQNPSPVGLVLMNHATDNSGKGIQLVNDIIEMNGKFYLKREGGDVTTGDGTNQGTTPASNAAYAVVGGDAF